MPTQKLSPEIINAAIEGFESQKRHIDSQISELQELLHGGPAEVTALPEAAEGRRKMSAAGRRRIAAAQKARWAKVKATDEPVSSTQREAPKTKRRLSAAGRKAISDATKKRWALKRAEAAKSQAGAAKKSPAKKSATKSVAKKAKRQTQEPAAA